MRVREYGETLMLCDLGGYAHPSLMPGVSFLQRRSQNKHVGYFEIIFCPRYDPEFDQVARFVNRTAAFIRFRIVQRHRLMADWADRSLKGEQLIVVHLGPSGTRAAVLFFKLLIAPICLSVRQRTEVLLFLLGARLPFPSPSWTWRPCCCMPCEVC